MSTSTLGTGSGNGSFWSRAEFPHSLGMLYRRSPITPVSEFRRYRDGSGAMRPARYVDLIRDRLVRIMADGSIWMDMECSTMARG
jgi:hypothetical protein